MSKLNTTYNMNMKMYQSIASLNTKAKAAALDKAGRSETSRPKDRNTKTSQKSGGGFSIGFGKKEDVSEGPADSYGTECLKNWSIAIRSLEEKGK